MVRNPLGDMGPRAQLGAAAVLPAAIATAGLRSDRRWRLHRLPSRLKAGDYEAAWEMVGNLVERAVDVAPCGISERLMTFQCPADQANLIETLEQLV